MAMYNLLEYSDNYSITSGSLWNYYRDEVNDDSDENNPAGNFRLNNDKTTTSKYFEYKTKITEKTSSNSSRLDTEVFTPLKYLSSVWRSLYLPFINCVVELDLR